MGGGAVVVGCGVVVVVGPTVVVVVAASVVAVAGASVVVVVPAANSTDGEVAEDHKAKDAAPSADPSTSIIRALKDAFDTAPERLNRFGSVTADPGEPGQRIWLRNSLVRSS